MGEISEEIKAFFDEYEEGANTFDVAINQRERTEAWLAASPRGVAVAYNDEKFPARLQQRQQQLRDIGFQSAAITSLSEERLDDHYGLVKTAWSQQYQKDGAPISVDITVDYVVRVEDDKSVKILCSIAHEDEDELLRSKGVIV